MKRIKPSPNEHQWPRCETKTVACRKHDLVVRITDWTRDKDEPAYDVEVYIGGVYDWNESETFSTRIFKTKGNARRAATKFAQDQIAKLL
jgi:hypothetical protein